jgi:N-methylhydantoinase A/oxoprolinase/acetone carboxylase beta subunit
MASPAPAPTLVIAGYPIRLPAVAVHTSAQAAGRSRVADNGGALVVGPEARRLAWAGLLRAR